MPRKEINYLNTEINKILCNHLNIKESYVGHTTDFTKRKNQHKYSCNTETHKTHNYKVYQLIRFHGGWLNWSMIEVEKYPCNDANEACARERYWLESLNASLNMVVPSRTQKEYYETQKDAISEKRKETYRINHDEKLLKFKEYRDVNKDKIKAFREANRDEFNRKQREKRALVKLQKQL